MNLRGANLQGVTLHKAYLRRADLSGLDLSNTSLFRSTLDGANLSKAILLKANLYEAHLSGANLIEANLSGADLRGAELFYATLTRTDFTSADLTGCCIFGISAWGLKLNEETKQQNLVITGYNEPEITVDNIEVAQFVYLLLHNEKLRNVINSFTTKIGLILGRFTPERKAVLDSLRDELRRRHYLPILFDFEKPRGRDLTETVSLLAHLARFVVADITDAKSIPQELAGIVPGLPSVPVQPLLQEGSDEYSMFEHFRRYPWVLEPYRYQSQRQLLTNLRDRVIDPAEAKVQELRGTHRDETPGGLSE